MRNGFREIVDGWQLLDDPRELDERIQRATNWIALNRPAERQERLVVALIIERGITLAARRIVSRVVSGK